VATSIFDLNPDRAAEAVGVHDVHSDLALVESLRAGSEQAYEELIRRFQQPVYAFAMRLLGDQGEACDVVQEVFLKVFRYVGEFRGQSTLKTWIYRITFNESQNARRWHFRHRGREVELDHNPDEARDWKDMIADTGRSPFDEASEVERAALIQAALQRIRPVFREAVVLRDTMDMSYEEVADLLHLSLGTVKSRIRRGREALQKELAGTMKTGPALQLVPKIAE
jgi:RNA polymerase sigma-70 factor (ECF subfamily)